MQERFGFGTLIEVTGFLPQYKIGDESGPARDVFAQTFELVRQQDKPAIYANSGENDYKRGKDTFGSTGIKIQKTETPLFEMSADDRCNQETRDHEENID